ncbi:MAG: amidohydrolase family protein [Bacteroidota bacterium]
MYSTRAGVLALIFALTVGCDAQTPAPVTEADYAFVNVSVLPMDSERVVKAQTVLVAGDRIVAVGSAAELDVPADAEVIDGEGRFLMPGLAEMHGHVPAPNHGYVEETLFLYLSNGITTVRGMLGWPGQLELRAQALSGDLLSPTLYLAGPSFNGQSVFNPAQAAQRVREQVAEGWDLLKVHPGLTRAEYDSMAAAANELGIRFGGHVPADVGILRALEAGQETFDHLDGYLQLAGGNQRIVPDDELHALAEQTKAAGAWVVPTMRLWDTVLGAADLDQMRAYEELQYMPEETVNGWIGWYENKIAQTGTQNPAAQLEAQNRIRLLNAFDEAGVDILMGTDAPQLFSVPGFSLHREIQAMREAGMSPYAVLKSGTSNVGRYFSNEDTFGLVAENHRADLLLLDANPLADVANLQRQAGVMVRGRWLPQAEIERRLEGMTRSG